MNFLIVIVLNYLLFINTMNCVKLEQKFKWREVEYDWPSEDIKQKAIDIGLYQIDHNLPLGLDVWNDKLFITVPRWKSGVPSSLNYVKISSNDQSPLLHPYPNWESNTLPHFQNQIQFHDSGDNSQTHIRLNTSITSTFRLRVDECDRLWVMDTGLADILGDPLQVSAPTIVIFDLKTDKLIRRIPFTEDEDKEDSFFANIVVDVLTSDCNNAHAYIPDLGTYALVVYSFKSDKLWRVKHNFFHFDPLHGDYDIGGVNFQWTDGIFGLALSKPLGDGSRTVYFHALSSIHEFAVSNRILQNETHVTGDNMYYDFKLIGDRGPKGQSSAEFLHEPSGILFYTQVNKDGIGCWNTRKPYETNNLGLVDSDSDALIFPNDLKVDRNDILWVLSDRMPVYLLKKLDSLEHNYRILRGNVNEIIQGTPCV